MAHATTSELIDERAQEDVLIVRLLLLHGFTATGRSWDAVRRRIDGATYSEVLAPDLRDQRFPERKWRVPGGGHAEGALLGEFGEAVDAIR